MKTCTKCGVEKPLDEFYRSRDSRDGRRPDCAACVRERHATYPKHVSNRKAYLKRVYGITPERYEEMWDAQGGECAGCGDPMQRGQRGGAVDHCHESGRIRGLLCTPCNLALGYVKDDPDRLRGLIAYLEEAACLV
jgi:hypothetical protein